MMYRASTLIIQHDATLFMYDDVHAQQISHDVLKFMRRGLENGGFSIFSY